MTPIFTVNYNLNLLHTGFKGCKKVKKYFIVIIPLGVIMMVIMVVGVLCACVSVYFLAMRLFGLDKESVRDQEKWAEASGVQREKGND